MLKKHAFLVIGIVLLHGVLGYCQSTPTAHPEASQASQPPCFSIAVASPETPLQLGKPLEVQVTVKNISGKDIYWSYAKTNTPYKAFHIRLDKDGREAGTTMFHRKISGNQLPGDPQEIENSSSVALPFAANTSFTWKIDISKLYQIEQPGVYTLSISRFDDCSKTTVQSKLISLNIGSQ